MSGKVQSPPDIAARCRHVVAAAEGRKAQEFRVLELGQISSLADYFLICSGNSERQVRAIADAIVETLRAEKVRPHHVEGHQHGRWVLLDYGDFVVHVFEQSTRALYALEKLWADAPDVTAEFVK
jgi:ribosome-associated protein